MKPKGHLHLATYCKELVPATAATFGPGLVVLLPFTDVGSENQHVAVILQNDDAAIAVDLIVDVSHGGVYANPDKQQKVTVAAQSEGSVEIGPPNPHTYIRVSAQPASGSPTGKYAIVTQER